MSTRLSEEEYRLVDSLSDRLGISHSTLLREAATSVVLYVHRENVEPVDGLGIHLFLIEKRQITEAFDALKVACEASVKAAQSLERRNEKLSDVQIEVVNFIKAMSEQMEATERILPIISDTIDELDRKGRCAALIECFRTARADAGLDDVQKMQSTPNYVSRSRTTAADETSPV